MAQRGSNNDTAMSWEALAGLAESRAIGKGSDPDATSPTGRRVPVRDLRRTADRAPKMYAPIDNRVAKKRAGYDTDSDEEGASPVAAITANAINLNAPPPRPIRAPHQGKFNSGGGEEKLETEYMEVDNLLASPFGDRGDRPSPKRGQVKSPSRTDNDRGGRGDRGPRRSRRSRTAPDPLPTAIGVEEPTILEKSLHAIAAETGMDTLNVQTLESALEATGASAKLRAMTNEEAKRDALERSMYELAEIPAGVMGHLKRTVWSYPNHDSGMKYYKAKSVLKDAKEPYPLWKTQTGRFCFTSGLCRLAVHFDPFLEGTRSELDPFGLPYSRYFKFLKFAFWICVAAMLASVPNMALFHEGGTYTEAAAVHMEPYIAFEHGRYHDTSGLHARPVQAATYIDVKRAAERITLGNLLLLPDNVTTFDAFNSIGLHVPLSRNLFGLFVTGDVVLVGIVLLAGVTWFWRNTLANNARETWNPHGTVTIEEYSVSVSGLPRFTTKEELKAHLEGITEERIKEVVLAEDFRDLASMLQERNSLMEKIDLLDGQIQYIKHADRAKAINWDMKDLDEDAEGRRLKEEYDKALGKTAEEPRWVQKSRGLDNKRRECLRELNLLLHRMEGRHFAARQVSKYTSSAEAPMVGAFVIKPPIIAYVTWETVGGRHSCLREYPKSLLTYAFMHPAKKLRGHRLVVRPAPSPASLAWEHIGTPWYLVKLLEVAFGLLAGVFIVIPLVLIHIGRKLSFSANGYDFTWYDQNDVLEVDRITKSCAVNPIPSLAFLTSLNDTSVLPSTHCICSWMSPADSSQGMCAGWHQSVTIQAIGVVSVVMVNLLMGRLLRLFSRFEGHYSSTSVFIVMTCHRLVHKSAFAADDERETSVFRRLMILQFINTSCITVFSSSKFEALFGGTSKGLGDFDWHWYRDVGTDLIFIVWLHGLLPIFQTGFSWCLQRVYWFIRNHVHIFRYKSQTEMNRDYIPPKFCLPERLSLMANVLIVCIIYGGGVPLLYPSAACVLLIRFWWDKLVLFRMSAVPNLFHARVMDMLVPWLTAAVTLNLVLSTWMFSKDMFLDWDLVKSFQKVIGVPSGTVDTSVVIGGRSLGSIGNRLCTVHMIPLVVFTVILLAVLAAAGLVRLMKAIVYIASGGTRCSAPDMSDIKVVQRRTVVDHSLGSQCLLYGGRRRVKRTRVATEAGMGLKDYDPETVDDHVIAQVARTIETTVRFAVEDDIGAAAAADEEFPEYLPIQEAIRKGRFVGLPSYHMIDNPVYREALPFGDQDLEMVRQHGLATMARIRTTGGSPIRAKRVPMPPQ